MPALSATAKQEYYVELGNSLPPPATGELKHRERRLITGVETFEALRPGDAYEARLAVQVVLSGARAAECLHLASIHHDDFPKMMRCCAQSASFMREERAAKRMLAQEQKVRLAVEAVAGAAPAQPAVASAPPPQAEPQAAPLSVPAESESPPSPEAIAKAEAVAEESIEAAAQIRRDRGVTPRSKALFRHVTLPTDPAVIDALVRGTSDLLSLLDEVGGERLDQAA
jgi:hypothetical protein